MRTHLFALMAAAMTTPADIVTRQRSNPEPVLGPVAYTPSFDAARIRAAQAKRERKAAKR